MKLLGRTQPLAHLPIEEALERLHAVGFDGVEICLEPEDMAPDRLTPQRIAALREQVSALGLQPVSISYHVDYVYNNHLFQLSQEAIRLTPEFGTNLFVFSGPPQRTGDADEWKRMVRRTRTLARLAEMCGVVLAEEFEPGFVVGSTAATLKLMCEVASPALMVNLDLGHVFLCDPDPLAAIYRIGRFVVHCHIENMATGVHDHLLPQEGNMDLVKYLEALYDIGYDGPLSLDLYKYDYEAVAPGAIACLREWLHGIETRKTRRA